MPDLEGFVSMHTETATWVVKLLSCASYLLASLVLLISSGDSGSSFKQLVADTSAEETKAREAADAQAAREAEEQRAADEKAKQEAAALKAAQVCVCG